MASIGLPKLRLVNDRIFYRNIVRIMLPIALQQAINLGVNMMDTVMLSSFGEAQISGSSLANSFYNLFTILCLGINGGCSVVAAQYWGAGNKEKVQETFSLAFRIVLIAGILFAGVTAMFPYPIMRIYTSEAAVIEYGVRYLRITAFVYLFHGSAMIMAFLMRSIGNANLGFFASLSSFLINIFFNWVFIFGKLGAPRMEIAGAALGTLIARVSECAIVFVYIFVSERELQLKPGHLWRRPSKELFYNYKRLGFAALISDFILGFGNNASNMILGHMGAVVVAANAVCQVVERLLNVVAFGIANAAGIVIGNTIGHGEKEKALEQGKTLYYLGMVLGAVTFVLVLVFGTLSIRFYSLEAETVKTAKNMMIAYAGIAVFETMQLILTKGVLRGGGDTKFLLVADILFLWVASIPLGILVGLVFGGPAWLTIICLRIDWVIKSIWCAKRLNNGKWIKETQKLT